MEHVRSHRSDAVFVRNPDYRETTTQDSYALAAKGLTGSCLFMDADILFDATSFQEFAAFASLHPLVIGVTAAKTDDAVYAVMRETGESGFEIVSFSREAMLFEWANIVYAPAGTFREGNGAVFEILQTLLPARAKEIVSYEVDTAADLMRAREFARMLATRA
jgi:choline kinase